MTDLKNIPGYMPLDTLDTLSDIIKQRPNLRTVVEVGSYCGRSAIAIAQKVSLDTNVFCIDHFYDEIMINSMYADGKDGRPLNNSIIKQYEEFVKYTSPYPNIHMMRGHFPYTVQWTGEDIDVMYLDSDHKNPEDLDILSHMCTFMKAGSVLMGDDHNEDYIHGQAVIDNVKLLETVYNTKAEFFGERKDLWLIHVTKDYINLEEYL
jgi:hypothetical protein